MIEGLNNKEPDYVIHLDNVDELRGKWPGAISLCWVEYYDGLPEDTPNRSWVITDMSDNQWIVVFMAIMNPSQQSDVTIMYAYENNRPYIYMIGVETLIQKEYIGFYKLINALRLGPVKWPGAKPLTEHDLAASLIASGKKSYTEALDMFDDFSKDAARKALQRRGISSSGRIE